MNIINIKDNIKTAIKGTFILLIFAIMIITMTGCQNNITTSEDGEVEIVNLAKLSEGVGGNITILADIQDVEYYIIDETMGKIIFTVEGTEYTCFIESSVSEINLFEEINGSDMVFTVSETGLYEEETYTIMTSVNNVNLMMWYDDEEALTYCLCSQGTATSEDLIEIGKKFITSQTI